MSSDPVDVHGMRTVSLMFVSVDNAGILESDAWSMERVKGIEPSS